jgi:hypothetical protein
MGRWTTGDEKGVALIIALLVLLVLTLLGVSLINTTIFETSISGNERTRVDAFYTAEAGIQRALAQLPAMTSIPRTQLGKDSYYWSGTVKDRNKPGIESLGLAFQHGSELSEVGFKRLRIRMTGGSLGAVQELEVQVKCSQPIRPTTEY